MGIFDKFKRKKETAKEETPKIKTYDKDEIKEKPFREHNGDICTLNDETYIKKNTPMHGLWEVYQTENGRNDIFEPLEFIESIIIDAKKSAVNSGMDAPNKIEAELIRFIREIQKHCDKVLTKIKNEKLAAEKENADKKAPVFKPVNAEPILYMTKNKVRLWAVVIPPLYGGENLSHDTLKFRMDSLSVKYGIKNQLINKILSDKIYFKIFQIAEGVEAVNGKSGSVKNLFSTVKNQVNIKEDNHGNVNYKELNMIQSIHKGDTICEITLPTAASDGMTVTGEVIKGREGKFPSVPAGKNTEFTEDKTRLISKIDGEVVFEDNKFNVRNILTISHDVDNSIGNINFAGDVMIKGDVREGYTVKADGDIRITGNAEGATVIAGGDLVIDRGMTGGNKGVIEVQGTLKCRYLENCRVYAKAGIEADQIMYSTLSTDEKIIVKGRKGSVIGGKLIAGRGIEAVTIGTMSNSNLKNEIVLGAVPHLVEKEKELQQQFDATQSKLHKMSQDIKYIESKKENINQERKELLKKLVFQYQIDEMQKKKLEEELSEIREKIQSNTEKCSLKCDNIYPIINLNVCGSSYILDMELKECRISRKDDQTFITSPMLTEVIVF